MSLGDQIPYEPLDDEAWDEMAEVVFDELDAGPAAAPARRPRRRAWGVGVAAALVAVAALVGLVGAARWSTTDEPAAQTVRLATSSGGSRATLGEVEVELAASTAGLAVGSDATGWVVALEQGRATFSVPPRRGRPPFVVQAGSVRIEVVGTRFEVARERAGVRVSVGRGAVRVVSDGRAVTLRAGQSWRSPPDEPADRAERPEATREPAPVQVDPERARSEAERDEPAGAHAPPPDPVEDDARPPPFDGGRVFARAAALEASDPDRASALYARVAARGGAWAGPALFARGRLAHERGQTSSSRALLRRYLARFPDGLNARDAERMLAATD